MTTQGKRLKQIRQKLNLSQEEMGKVLGVSKQFLSNIENDRNILNNEKLVKLLQNYNVSINWLLSGEGEMFKKSSKNEDFDKKVELKVTEILDRYGLTDKIQ
jgi:transcriptional regulator with XRE-family HTH domain